MTPGPEKAETKIARRSHPALRAEVEKIEAQGDGWPGVWPGVGGANNVIFGSNKAASQTYSAASLSMMANNSVKS